MRDEIYLANRIFGVPDLERVVMDYLTLFCAASAGRDKLEEFPGYPDPVVAMLLLSCRSLRQPGAVSADGAHEAGCSVPENLRGHLVEIGLQIPVLELRILLVDGDRQSGKRECFPGKGLKIPVFFDLRVIDGPLATHPLRQDELLL